MKIDFPKLSSDLTKVTIPCIVQPKLDGEFCVWDGNFLYNRFGRKRYLPFCKFLPKNLSVMGELYFNDGKNNFYEALSHLKTDSPQLKFAVFGLYDVNIPYCEQMSILKLAINKTEAISIIEGMTAYSHLETDHYCEEYLKQGYEGSVIKPLHAKSPASWIKYKPDKTIDLCILGISKKKNSIAVGLPDGTILGHCSVFGWQEVFNLLEKEKIIGTTKEEYLITPKYIVEVKHLGWINNSSLRSPRISRIREDLTIQEVAVV